MIKVQCPRCKESFKAPDAYAGKTAQCPTCKHQVSIPIPAPVQLPTNQTKPSGKKRCPKCKEWINEKATKCPYCQSERFSPIRVLAGVILSIIAIVVCICIMALQSDSSGTKVSERSASIGDLVSLRQSDDSDAAIIGAIDKRSYDEYLKCTEADGFAGLPALVEQDRLVRLPYRARARIINDSYPYLRQVRILTGSYLRCEFWVSTDDIEVIEK